jgi:hypothetical protein
MRAQTVKRGGLGRLATVAAIASLLLAGSGLAWYASTAGWVGGHRSSSAADSRTGPSPSAAPPTRAARYASFGAARPSADARRVADWVADSGDNAGADFVIVDKRFATLYVFDTDATLRGSSPVLLGAAVGDDSVPGIGARQVSQVLPAERTTPAGRFVAERGHNALGRDVVWVDYDARVSMHRVVTTDARERRLQRLATPGVEDKRISYGCINVPVAFYESVVRPTFARQRAVVYVLPEVKSVQQVFGAYDVAAAHRAAAGSSAGLTNHAPGGNSALDVAPALGS